MSIPMNRKQKRSGGLDTPCTIAEAVQIARATAEDVFAGFQRNQGHLEIAQSLQIDILKDLVISSGLITEEEYRAKYMEKAEEFNKRQEEAYAQQMGEYEDNSVDEGPTMEPTTDGIEVTTEQD